MKNDEFYIGYYGQTPPGLAKYVRKVIFLLAIIIPVAALLLAARQGPVESGVFEFGVSRTFEGVLYETPVPTLRVMTTNHAVVNLLLVGAGKHGLPDFALSHEGKKVRFNGSLVYRENLTMIELNDPKSFQVVGEPKPEELRGRAESIGEVTLTGELVDTKCYFGVMRPATGKVHRACAVRCLSGGVPPGLLVRDESGNASVVMLAAADSGKLNFDVEWAAQVLEAKGKLEVQDGVPILRVETLRLLPSVR